MAKSQFVLRQVGTKHVCLYVQLHILWDVEIFLVITRTVIHKVWLKQLQFFRGKMFTV